MADTVKKGKKGLKIVVILLILLLIAMIIAYKFLTKQTISQKEVFAKHIADIKMENVFGDNIYKNIMQRMLTLM